MSTSLQSKQFQAPKDLPGFYEYAYAQGWTDGLPVIPPTPQLVEAFVRASGHQADEVVAEVQPRRGAATVEKLAINSVMAGCKPEYMPAILAAVRAISKPEFNLDGIQCTTGPVGPMLIFNGPVRHRLKINCGRNCLGPGVRANATIGRAMRLVLLNIGGGIPGVTDKATHGFPGKYSMCFGEMEEESPWEPFQMGRGFKREESTVTVVGVNGTTNVCPLLKRAESILGWVADSLSMMGANHTVIGAGDCVTVLPPGHAKLLHEQGYDKAKVSQWLYEHSRIAVSAYPPEGNSSTGKWVRRGDFVYIPPKWENLLVVVAGGPEPYHIVSMPSWGETWAVTEKIEEPSQS